MDMGAFSGAAQLSEGGMASLVRKISIEGDLMKQVISAEEECFSSQKPGDGEPGSPTFAPQKENAIEQPKVATFVDDELF